MVLASYYVITSTKLCKIFSKKKNMRLKAMKENKNVFNGKRNRLQLNLDGGSVFINASSVVGVYKLIKSLIL